MLKKLIESLRLRFGDQKQFDPARFEDPIALQTEWTPAKGGGANFRTHKMAQTGMSRFEFRATAGAGMLSIMATGRSCARMPPPSRAFSASRCGMRSDADG